MPHNVNVKFEAMEEKYLEILRHYVNPNDCKTVIQMLLNLHSVMPRYLVANSTPTIDNKTCLTIGKKYEILHEHDDGMVCVVDDYGDMEIMVKSFFNEA